VVVAKWWALRVPRAGVAAVSDVSPVMAQDIPDESSDEIKAALALLREAGWIITRPPVRSVPVSDVPIITLSDAKKRGLRRYFTGKPCRFGHIAQRRVKGCVCLECLRELRLTEEFKAKKKEYNQRSEVKARRVILDKRPHIIERKKRYEMMPWTRVSRKKYNDKRRSTIMGAMNCRMSGAVKHCLEGKKMGVSWQHYVGYSARELCDHIERQFVKGMSWDNRSEWHIDHIVPLASFEFTSPDDTEFKAAWALANLRPLWATDNIRKKDKRIFLI
jgi:Uri superfamily endonuclease